MPRPIDCRYADPLELIWLACAARCGLRVLRSDEVYASYDGAGTLTLSTPREFDADDCLAQLILHELCHALVQGEQALTLQDWGLCNRDERDLGPEHACHRLQAALCGRHGLRGMLAPTTEHRAYYDALPADPLADDGDDDDPAVAPAREGWQRATTGPWAEPLEQALAATAALARAAAPFADAGSLWARAEGEPRSG